MKTKLDYDLGNYEIIKSAYERWRLGEFDSVIFRCYNETEAKDCRRYATNVYPDLPISFTWNEFETTQYWT